VGVRTALVRAVSPRVADLRPTARAVGVALAALHLGVLGDQVVAAVDVLGLGLDAQRQA